MVELRCPQSPEDPGDHSFLISAHFLLTDGIELLSEEAVNSSVLSPEVSGLVEMLWAEALSHLEHTVLRPVHRTSLNDVSPVSLRPTLMGPTCFS
ncbi:hypothetical protein J1605_007291 [Eschrichtius robustus]|uniref:PARP4 WGR-like domain-containing protein n=1 Tax=Eschrichtius robustus TaxID=9764 RepID=A0AB34H1Y7_ESCRO|nr:hypothetical protein J1605_007291 [Eschrichtius robustus]